MQVVLPPNFFLTILFARCPCLCFAPTLDKQCRGAEQEQAQKPRQYIAPLYPRILLRQQLRTKRGNLFVAGFDLLGQT